MRGLLLLACLLAPALGRHSLHWGPQIESSFTTLGESIEFRPASLLGGGDPRVKGRAVADEFVTALFSDRKLEWRHESSILNAGSGILANHYVQRFNSRDVATGTLNVNVDVHSGRVISYGNAFFDHRAHCGAEEPPIGQGHQQVVLGGSRKKWACVDALSEARDETPIDPRVALVSFLLPVRSAEGILAVTPDAHLDNLVESMWIEHPFRPSVASSAENRVLVHGAPGASQPVEARLSHVAHDGRLKLVWEFVYHSNDNSYNAFVSAQVGEGMDTLAVTDWVRDFAPNDDIPDFPNPVPPKQPKKSPKQPKQPPTKEPKTPKEPKAPVPEPVDPSKAEYMVWSWACNDPTQCDRTLMKNPADKVASPNGWHYIPSIDKSSKAREDDWAARAGWTAKLGGGLNSTDRGPTVVHCPRTLLKNLQNWSGLSAYELNHRPSHQNLSFHDKTHWGHSHANSPNWTDHQVDPKSYIDVSVTELFYTINELHDLTYRYGFDEEAGNFQQVNDKTGRGAGGDPVIAMAQDGSGTNNANFMTPPDGQPGRMRMYIWTTGDQVFYRDGDLEAGIVTHEFMHGVSTRLTGPPSNPSCLAWGESGGMGEAWGDWAATLIRHHGRGVHDWPMGSWAYGTVGGIRNYPYSVNHTTNPTSYSYLNKPGYWEVHKIGEVWAEMLFEVTEALIVKHGYSKTLFPPVPTSNSTFDAIAAEQFFNISSTTGRRYPSAGNTYSMQLILDGMKLQPCRPKFVEARDAILQADNVLTGGENKCLIWKAFSSRGLGPNAEVKGQTPWGGGLHTEDFSLPSACKKSKA